MTARKKNTPRKIEIGNDVEELKLDLTKPRMMKVLGVNREGVREEWHLKVTSKGRLALL